MLRIILFHVIVLGGVQLAVLATMTIRIWIQIRRETLRIQLVAATCVGSYRAPTRRLVDAGLLETA